MNTPKRGLWSAGLALAILAAGAVETRAQAAEEEAEIREVTTHDATRGRELDEGQTMLVRVSNTIQPARSVVVSIIGGTRPEHVLGAVPVGETREWKIDTRLYPGGIRLKAAAGRGFTLVNGVQAVSQARATWNLGIDFMRYERLEDREETETVGTD